jgi:hypothetical protein
MTDGSCLGETGDCTIGGERLAVQLTLAGGAWTQIVADGHRARVYSRMQSMSIVSAICPDPEPPPTMAFLFELVAPVAAALTSRREQWRSRLGRLPFPDVPPGSGIQPTAPRDCN